MDERKRIIYRLGQIWLETECNKMIDLVYFIFLSYFYFYFIYFLI